jgi:hypothetical protein
VNLNRGCAGADAGLTESSTKAGCIHVQIAKGNKSFDLILTLPMMHA